MRTLARRAIEKVVARFGYELRIVGSPPVGYESFLHRIAKAGVQPATVFDVGVGNGTPWLYAAFPQAHFVLLEPQREFEPQLKRICTEIDAEYHLVGIGSTEKDLPIYRMPGNPTGSSFLHPTDFTNAHAGMSAESATSLHIVPMDTFCDLPHPFFLKIDTEGYELEVLRGASKVLERTDVVLAEVAIADRREGQPGLVEIASYLQGHGFRLIDFPVLAQRTVNGPPVFADVAFARDDCAPMHGHLL